MNDKDKEDINKRIQQAKTQNDPNQRKEQVKENRQHALEKFSNRNNKG